MITKSKYAAIIGFTTLLIQQRKLVDEFERSAVAYLKDIGAEDRPMPFEMSVADYVEEAAYNSGDDPEVAARELLDALNLEVES